MLAQLATAFEQREGNGLIGFKPVEVSGIDIPGIGHAQQQAGPPLAQLAAAAREVEAFLEGHFHARQALDSNPRGIKTGLTIVGRAGRVEELHPPVGLHRIGCAHQSLAVVGTQPELVAAGIDATDPLKLAGPRGICGNPPAVAIGIGHAHAAP